MDADTAKPCTERDCDEQKDFGCGFRYVLQEAHVRSMTSTACWRFSNDTKPVSIGPSWTVVQLGRTATTKDTLWRSHVRYLPLDACRALSGRESAGLSAGLSKHDQAGVRGHAPFVGAPRSHQFVFRDGGL